jgi:hypothetical protein
MSKMVFVALAMLVGGEAHAQSNSGIVLHPYVLNRPVPRQPGSIDASGTREAGGMPSSDALLSHKIDVLQARIDQVLGQNEELRQKLDRQEASIERVPQLVTGLSHAVAFGTNGESLTNMVQQILLNIQK